MLIFMLNEDIFRIIKQRLPIFKTHTAKQMKPVENLLTIPYSCKIKLIQLHVIVFIKKGRHSILKGGNRLRIIKLSYLAPAGQRNTLFVHLVKNADYTTINSQSILRKSIFCF